MKLPSGRHNVKQLRAIFARYRRLDIKMIDHGYTGPRGRTAGLQMPGQTVPGIPEAHYQADPHKLKYAKTPAGHWFVKTGGAVTYEGRKGLADFIRGVRQRGSPRPALFEKRMARLETMSDAIERRKFKRHIENRRIHPRSRRKIAGALENMQRLRPLMRENQRRVAIQMGEI